MSTPQELGKGHKEFRKEYQIVNSYTYKKKPTKNDSGQVMQIKSVEVLSLRLAKH